MVEEGTYAVGWERGDSVGEFGRFDQYGFVGGVGGEAVAGADYDFDDGTFHEAGGSVSDLTLCNTLSRESLLCEEHQLGRLGLEFCEPRFLACACAGCAFFAHFYIVGGRAFNGCLLLLCVRHGEVLWCEVGCACELQMQ
jgi:hypothetical protein